MEKFDTEDKVGTIIGQNRATPLALAKRMIKKYTYEKTVNMCNYYAKNNYRANTNGRYYWLTVARFAQIERRKFEG